MHGGCILRRAAACDLGRGRPSESGGENQEFFQAGPEVLALLEYFMSRWLFVVVVTNDVMLLSAL